LKDKPAFIRSDREAKIASVFEGVGLDGSKMAEFDNPGPLEMLVRKGTNGEAWVQQVIDALVRMLPEEAATAPKKMTMDENSKDHPGMLMANSLSGSSPVRLRKNSLPRKRSLSSAAIASKRRRRSVEAPMVVAEMAVVEMAVAETAVVKAAREAEERGAAAAASGTAIARRAGATAGVAGAPLPQRRGVAKAKVSAIVPPCSASTASSSAISRAIAQSLWTRRRCGNGSPQRLRASPSCQGVIRPHLTATRMIRCSFKGQSQVRA